MVKIADERGEYSGLPLQRARVRWKPGKGVTGKSPGRCRLKHSTGVGRTVAAVKGKEGVDVISLPTRVVPRDKNPSLGRGGYFSCWRANIILNKRCSKDGLCKDT